MWHNFSLWKNCKEFDITELYQITLESYKDIKVNLGPNDSNI
jgi:hypothetical protein